MSMFRKVKLRLSEWKVSELKLRLLCSCGTAPNFALRNLVAALKMSVNLNKNKAQILDAWKKVTENEDGYDWALFGLKVVSDDENFENKKKTFNSIVF
jgi:hypothetical protein